MKQVTVTYHHEGTSWWAESSDLEGFTAAANTFAELRSLVVDGVAFYLNDAPHSLAERLDSGALLDRHSSEGGWTSSWSGRLATAISTPRQSVEVQHAQYA